ncbi:hypothetical protein GGS24DRAFT_459379 [Hypoxylon argillaceum]|nr:hypothetical protein GGS24DRAFT_459379 [Hypoxylon argillaceum]
MMIGFSSLYLKLFIVILSWQYKVAFIIDATCCRCLCLSHGLTLRRLTVYTAEKIISNRQGLGKRHQLTLELFQNMELAVLMKPKALLLLCTCCL